MPRNETNEVNETIASLIATACNIPMDRAAYLAEHCWQDFAIGDLPTLRERTGLSDDHLAPFVAARTLLQLPKTTSPVMNRPDIVAGHAMQHYGGKEQEHFIIYILNTRNRLLKHVLLYIGTINELKIRPAECFKDAIRINAAHIIAVHNHPSGDVDPSREDIAVTTTLINAGDMLGINVLDHIIVGPTSYVSIRERRPDLWDKKGDRS